MTVDARYHQFALENEVLDHVKIALRETLLADTSKLGLSRQVSTVQFVTDSLDRHLRRLMELEESEGIVDIFLTDKQYLIERARSLQREHQGILKMLGELSHSVRALTPVAEPQFTSVRDTAIRFLDELDRHEEAEMGVLRQLYNDDEGGEG